MVLSEIQWIEEMTERGRGGEEERERERRSERDREREREYLKPGTQRFQAR